MKKLCVYFLCVAMAGSVLAAELPPPLNLEALERDKRKDNSQVSQNKPTPRKLLSDYNFSINTMFIGKYLGTGEILINGRKQDTTYVFEPCYTFTSPSPLRESGVSVLFETGPTIQLTKNNVYLVALEGTNPVGRIQGSISSRDDKHIYDLSESTKFISLKETCNDSAN